MKLRSYQSEAIRQINLYFNQISKRVMLRMPTGSGKTTVFSEIIKHWDGPVLFIVRGRKLVSQASERLTRESVDHDIIMAGEKNPRSLAARVQVASIDTLRARRITPPATLLVIDEAHLARSEAFDWLFSFYPDAYFLSVTATPYHARGFREIADAIIEVVKVPELIADGFLVRGKYFAPAPPDLSTVKKADGDYVKKDLAAAMNQSRLFGDIISTYKRLGEGRPSLLFAVNIDHSRRLCEAFNQAGIPSDYIDSESSPSVRASVIDRLERRVLSVVCSVGCLAVGVDLPIVSCLIIARPTLSLALWQQILGRGTRPYPEKTDMRVLDHSGNTERLGFYETYHPATLDGKIPAFRVVLNRCEKCYFIWTPTGDPACPGRYPDGSVCGHVKPVVISPPRKIKTDTSVDLVELTPEELERRTRETWIDDTIRRCAEAGYKQGAAYYQIKSRYGATVANGTWGRIRAGFKVEDL